MDTRIRPTLFVRTIGVVIVIPFLMGTSPEPPPYHQYLVSGMLERPAGGSKQDFAVTLLGWFQYQTDSVFVLFDGVTYPKFGDFPIDLTDSIGAFTIRLSHQIKADSVRLAVIVPDNPSTVGIPWFVGDIQGIPHTETFEVAGEPGCFGTESDPTTVTVTSFYSYSFVDRVITISY